ACSPLRGAPGISTLRSGGVIQRPAHARPNDVHLVRARWMTRLGFRLLLSEIRHLAGRAGVTHYDSRSDRAFTSSPRCRTISAVLRISGSLRETPMVEASASSRATTERDHFSTSRGLARFCVPWPG